MPSTDQCMQASYVRRWRGGCQELLTFPRSGMVKMSSTQRLQILCMQDDEFFKTLHAEVSNNRGNWASHGCAFLLFVNRSILLEVCGSQNDIPKVGDLSRCQRRAVWVARVVLQFLHRGLYSAFDRNIGKEELYVERHHDRVVKDRLTAQGCLRAKGDKMLARQADSSYEKVLTHDTIDIKGTSALRIFGKPQILGGCLTLSIETRQLQLGKKTTNHSGASCFIIKNYVRLNEKRSLIPRGLRVPI